MQYIIIFFIKFIMMDYNRICELKVDEWIWVIFIILSILNIFGDECESKYCITNNNYHRKISKNIFTFTIFISLLIYLYLEYQRYNHLRDCLLKKQNTSIWELRCFGGFLIIVATLLFLYCQVVDSRQSDLLLL